MNVQNSGQFDNLRQKVASKEKLTSLSFSVIVHVFELKFFSVSCGMWIADIQIYSKEKFLYFSQLPITSTNYC